MPKIGHFLDVLDAISRRDFKSVEKIYQKVAAEERKRKHYKISHQILDALEVAFSGVGFEDQVGTVSAPASKFLTAKPSLLNEVDLDRLSPIQLNKSNLKTVNEFVNEWKHEGVLRDAGLSPRKSFLVYGPPGCGKSHLAKFISKSLNMRLFTVRFDSLISSFLGETGSNLKEVFQFAENNRCCIFLDEIDAIGKLRDDTNELGELKRVVITLLQNLDNTNGRSIFIAATNHPHMLDPALWRRFEVVTKLDPPDDKQRVKIIEEYMGETLSKDIAVLLGKCTEGMTGDDLVKLLERSKRSLILGEFEDLKESLFYSILEQIKRVPLVKSGKIDERKLLTALSLKKLFNRNYSFKELESLTEISHSTLHSRFSSFVKEE
jgi:SpoVK/Ycf46/Vps4 family AAA+-type ATPase